MSALIAGPKAIGPFRLVRRLAVGGVADIYLAQEFEGEDYRRTVVIKTVRSDMLEEQELLEMQRQEASLVACLDHDNIAQQVAMGEQDGLHYLALEFVFGVSLKHLRERCEELGEELPEAHLRTIMADTLDALQYAHHEAKQGGQPLSIVHRDVSPDNIMVGFDGTTKLLDFGMARVEARAGSTLAGRVKGKYAYMSPEQVQPGGQLDHRSDQFSAGVVLWEGLTGRRLFLRTSEYETVQAVLACQVPFARAQRPTASWRMSWVAAKALSKRPARRYEDAAAMREALWLGDTRARAEARRELSEWLAGCFSRRMGQRQDTLRRLPEGSAEYREIYDSGFALLDEVTNPDLPMAAADQGPPLGPDAPTGWAGVGAALFGSWRWLIVGLLSLTFLLGGLGSYLSHRDRAAPAFGYLYVYADEEGVKVSVDDESFGTAPVQRIAVSPGRHKVIGRHPESGERGQEVEVEAGESRVVELSF